MKSKNLKTFTRRISWMEFHEANFAGNFVAVWEYLGESPSKLLAHGNSHHPQDNYIRTNPSIIRKCEDMAKKQMKPNEIYKECLKENDVDGPRNCKQIRNIKYRAGPKESRQNHNVADDMLQILNMLHDHKYVKYIFNSKGSPMSVILYTV